jgi:hypothetical protein
MMWAKENRTGNKPSSFSRSVVMAVLMVIMVVLMAGCESDEDCLNCVDLPPPVVPTGVHSISDDNLVIVQWYDISYHPYDGSYNENVVAYYIYRRDFEEGDQGNPDREFIFLDDTQWDQFYDPNTGLHWYEDYSVRNGYQYEYAVTAVNAAGLESALSYEFVVDAPLPMSPFFNGGYISVELDDGNDGTTADSGFDFAKAASNQSNINEGRVDPATQAYDIKILFENEVPYVETNPARVHLQDFGVFTSGGEIIFEGVGWAPADGYSQTGKLELVAGHIYVVEIHEPELHYAKFGVTGTRDGSVNIIWAFQTIPGLPELKAPEDLDVGPTKPQIVSF